MYNETSVQSRCNTRKNKSSRIGVSQSLCAFHPEPITHRATLCMLPVEDIRSGPFWTLFLAPSVLQLSLLSLFEVCTKMLSHGLNLLSSLLFQMVTRTKKIFVGGLSANTVVEDVKQYFEQFGKVRSRFRWLGNCSFHLKVVWLKTFCPRTFVSLWFLL